jgi:hypothetical protein
VKNRKFTKTLKMLLKTKTTSKEVRSHKNRWKSALFITWFNDFICSRPKFFKNSQIDNFFLAKSKIYVSYDIKWWTNLLSFKDFDKPSAHSCRTLREWLKIAKREEKVLFQAFFIFSSQIVLIQNDWWRFYVGFSSKTT